MEAQTIDSKTIQSATGKTAGRLAYWIERLPMTSDSRQGQARAFSIGDATLILVADDLVTRGFQLGQALQIAAEIAVHLPRIIEHEHTAKLWLFGYPDDAGNYSYCLTADAEEGLDLAYECPDSLMLNLHKILARAMTRLYIAKHEVHGHA